MDSTNIDSAQNYYNPARKRSFFYSRLFVILSMVVLVIGLSINISLLYSNQKTSTTSHAASQDTLPSLPAGCIYEKANNKVGIVCPTPDLSQQTTKQMKEKYPIVITLPSLPVQCHYFTTNNGYKIACANPLPQIPNTPVTLPPACSTIANSNTIRCLDEKNQPINVQLPLLPQGCSYSKGPGGLVIACLVSSTQ